ncbi:MAG: MogA/MoaB family molybdenum cofactor biosynthesis protein [Silvibacterium sp.]|nr:MogA/MoaB family molybdenum cofactor biosynthesis protein [Silvibacterium sp.]
MSKAVVITVSDRCSRGEADDLSGPAVVQELESQGYEVEAPVVVADERPVIEDAIRSAAGRAHLVVTTGGTGVAPRDVTPEATQAVCDRMIPGIPELMRSEGRDRSFRAPLSRSVCGTLGSSLVLNLPGRPSGAVASLRMVARLLPHALDLLAGETRHDDAEDEDDQD